MKNKDIQRNEFKTKASTHVMISELCTFEAATICMSLSRRPVEARCTENCIS